MSILDRAKSHFADQLSGAPKEIDVPEWETTIYYKPISLKTKGELNKYVENPFEYAARALIARGLDENGDKLFKPANMTELMRAVDPKVVENIVLAMAQNDDAEDAEKN